MADPQKCETQHSALPLGTAPLPVAWLHSSSLLSNFLDNSLEAIRALIPVSRGDRWDRESLLSIESQTYSEIETLNTLAASLGFCLWHGTRLTTAFGTSALSSLEVVHSFAIRRLRAALEKAGEELAQIAHPAPCPVCRSQKEHAEREAFFLAQFFSVPGKFAHYGKPALLCVPHLRMVASHASNEIFKNLLGQHLSVLSTEREVAAGANEEDLATRLHLTVGADLGVAELPPFLGEDTARARASGDPVKRIAAHIAQSESCPICSEMRRAWIEWMNSLNDLAEQHEAIDDLLPTCPDHVWATVRLGGEALAVQAVNHARTTARSELQLVKSGLEPGSRTKRHSVRTLLSRLTDNHARRFDRARDTLSRPARCSVCERLIRAQNRALGLLFELIEQPRHRTAYENGYGICIKHLSYGLFLDPHPSAKHIIRVEWARLGQLARELEEMSRKMSWEVRAESKGAEEEAPKRAVRRFSGSWDLVEEVCNGCHVE